MRIAESALAASPSAAQFVVIGHDEKNTNGDAFGH
jgi:hypothetical protein